MSPETPGAGGSRARRSIALLVTTVLVGVAAGTAHAAVTSPRVRLVATGGEVTLWRYGPGEPVYLELGVLLGVAVAPFELRAHRTDYLSPVTLTQVLYGPGGQRELRDLDPALLDGWNGLAGFYEISFAKDGAEVAAVTQSFCPGGYDRQRVDDSGPDVPTYPVGCFSNPFTRGVVWGIDEGWAAGSSSGHEPPQLELANGRYTATVAIASRYVEVFGIPAADATASFPVRVRTVQDYECGHRCHMATQRAAADEQQAQSVPTVEDPDPATLPDLMALPSWGIHVENRRQRSTLTFGATVWNGGAADLVVEGFRRSDQAVMDAYQYFYDDGEVVGKAAAGELEFDVRDGHDHWHFQQFAAYSLLDAEGTEVRRSRKEAFCLAPTDAVDLTLPDADWNPGSVGLHTACGGPSAVWVREVLPLGWGDTYFQGLPGQSFWITKLPNGTYFIKVEANPGGMLHETTAANNVELRQIEIKGRPGARRVVVPPWNGIDTEGSDHRVAR